MLSIPDATCQSIDPVSCLISLRGGESYAAAGIAYNVTQIRRFNLGSRIHFLRPEFIVNQRRCGRNVE